MCHGKTNVVLILSELGGSHVTVAALTLKPSYAGGERKGFHSISRPFWPLALSRAGNAPTIFLDVGVCAHGWLCYHTSHSSESKTYDGLSHLVSSNVTKGSFVWLIEMQVTLC